MVKLNITRNFVSFKEPYADEDRFWLVDIVEGDVYKITHKIIECLNKIQKGEMDLDSEIVAELRDLKVIQDEQQ